MQANCLVFPSPVQFNIQPIIYKIVLISQDINQNQHIAYHHYLHLCEFNDEDDFQKTIKKLSNQNMLKTRDHSKYSKNQLKKEYLHDKQQKHSRKQQRHNHKQQKHSHKQQKNHQNHSKKQKKYHNAHQYSTTKQTQTQNKKQNQSTSKYREPASLQTNIYDNKINSEQFIACLFLPGKRDKIIVFFHANAEDITSSYQFLKMICIQTQYSILAMQYRGYSINKGETNPQKISQDANRVIGYLLQRNISPDQIIVFGRSIGCAIALGITRQELKIYAIVLLSPFLSLKKIAKQLYGNCAGWALKQGFDNQKNTLNINSPLLLIHGMKDTLVSYQHSLALFAQCKSYCQLKLIQSMTHSRFNFRTDFIRHFQMFVNDLQEREQN